MLQFEVLILVFSLGGCWPNLRVCNLLQARDQVKASGLPHEGRSSRKHNGWEIAYEDDVVIDTVLMKTTWFFFVNYCIIIDSWSKSPGTQMSKMSRHLSFLYKLLYFPRERTHTKSANWLVDGSYSWSNHPIFRHIPPRPTPSENRG